MTTQLAAVLLAAGIGLAWFAFEQARRFLLRRRLRGFSSHAVGDPYVLYFTAPWCSVCRLRQEPALARLGEGVRVERVNVAEDLATAKRFRVYTLPTTLVIGGEGEVAHSNFGYASPQRLERQLAEASSSRQFPGISAR